MGKSTLYVTKPQIINGQQTTRTLQKIEAKAGSLLVKVIKIPRNPGDDESYDSLVNSIVRATNFQNHIEPSDLVSNDYVQVSIERAMRKVGYQYIRKRMKKSEAWRLFRSLDYWQIDKRELAQAVAATLFDPVVVRKGKEGLFENPYYKSIFSSRSVGYYLSRYWLMSAVQYSARGKPDRAYGKWLVLNFAWELLSSSISSGEGERKFRNLVEIEPWNSKALHFLIQGINGIYLSVMKYYRTNRGTGAEAKDISSFFLLAGHHEKFRSFWVGSLNNQKTRVNISFNKFRQHLSSYEIQV